MKQIIVWGPPCSGKSTYVKNAMGSDDLRWDWDLLDLALSARTTHSLKKSPAAKLLYPFRRFFIEKTREMPGDGKVFIIASYLSESLMSSLDDKAEFVRMETPEHECLARLQLDNTRPDKAEWEIIIREWFSMYGDKEKSFVKYDVNKAAVTAKSEVSEAELELINRQALRDLTPEDVYTFKVRACDDLVDRDFERFTRSTLEKLATLFVGRTMIADHRWSADNQRARIYDTYIEDHGDSSALMAKCYMLRNESTRDIIAAIEGGILREVSVGCAISRAVCSICGKEYGTCGHQKGTTYDGELCVCELHDPVDAYEMSFVAVPAQPRAGITKSKKTSGWTPAELAAAKAQLEMEHEKWRYM